jgi:hypothetical protein
MYLNAKDNPWKAAKFFVIDLDTKLIIPHVQWADDELGTYAQYLTDKFDNIIFNNNDEPLVELKKGNIKLELQ